MEEDSSGLPGSLGRPSSAQVSVVTVYLDQRVSDITPTPSPARRRICSGSSCNRVLGSFLHDPHSFCIKCRGFCSPGKRCDECSGWSVDKVMAAYKYQSGLRRRRDSKAKRKGLPAGRSFGDSFPRSDVISDSSRGSGDSCSQISSAQSVVPVASELASLAGGALSQGDVTADDSVSQQGCKPPVALDITQFLHSWQEQILTSVNHIVTSRLEEFHKPVPTATDPPLSAFPSSSDKDLMQFSVLPPQSPDAKRCVKSHQVRGPRGAVRGLEASPKRSHPPKDGARRFKKSCPTSVVTGDLALSQARSVGGDRGEMSQRCAPGLSPKALGEASAGCDARPSAMSPRLPGGASPHIRAAASVLSVARGSVSPDPPTTHQTHCFAPEWDQPLPASSRGVARTALE